MCPFTGCVKIRSMSLVVSECMNWHSAWWAPDSVCVSQSVSQSVILKSTSKFVLSDKRLLLTAQAWPPSSPQDCIITTSTCLLLMLIEDDKTCVSTQSTNKSFWKFLICPIKNVSCSLYFVIYLIWKDFGMLMLLPAPVNWTLPFPLLVQFVSSRQCATPSQG